MATTVVPNVTPQTGGAVKGRRKLEFTEAQRFKGKHFFLDLKGYKRVKDVLHELTSRGAVRSTKQQAIHCIAYIHSLFLF